MLFLNLLYDFFNVIVTTAVVICAYSTVNGITYNINNVHISRVPQTEIKNEMFCISVRS